MKQQTSVNFLVNYMLENFHLTDESLEIFEKAKQMEKQQIIDAHHCGRNFEYKYPESDKTYNESAEQYYKETYETDN